MYGGLRFGQGSNQQRQKAGMAMGKEGSAAEVSPFSVAKMYALHYLRIYAIIVHCRGLYYIQLRHAVLSGFVGFEVGEGVKTVGQPSAAAALVGVGGEGRERGAPLKLTV